jgi:hypothetical protein
MATALAAASTPDSAIGRARAPRLVMPADAERAHRTSTVDGFDSRPIAM